MTKKREPIPPATAARVLFLADRTCCVCRRRGKPVQIHHIDDNPSNNDPANLAVLCFDCHRETQITGGFDRKLDADQVALFRDDWISRVARSRVEEAAASASEASADVALEVTTSVAEIYRDNQEWFPLAVHYHALKNEELRDKYIEQAISDGVSDSTHILMRGGMQHRPDLIPSEVIEREAARYERNEDWTQQARFYLHIGRKRDAVASYVKGVLQALDDDRPFSAAYYLRELVEERLIDALYEMAYEQATETGDLWWRVRALQDLGWSTELKSLLLEHAEEIDHSPDPMLHVLLAAARGDSDAYVTAQKDVARRLESHPGFLRIKPSQSDSQTDRSDGG